jgi:pyrroloquinoline quinone biosynthesis protein D
MSDGDGGADAILSVVLKHSSNYIWEEMDGQVLLYRVGAHKAVHLNDSAALIWKLCDGSRTLNDVIGVLSDTYPDMREAIAADVRSGARMLLTEGALIRTSME